MRLHNTLSLCCFLFLPVSAGAQNFVAADAALVHAAETARIRSALYWSGKNLPGNWSSPCPIHVRGGGMAAAGQTEFRFAHGEVFGWKTTVSGPRAALLADVIPHEVDHMVRASLNRHPIPRWLDEGCATLMESEETHQQLREWVAQHPALILDAGWLEQDHYPVAPAEVTALYAYGFSLVEFLLSRENPARLLAFQQSEKSIASRLQQHYGLTVETLQTDWQEWRAARQGHVCSDCACPIHSLPTSDGTAISKPVLQVWTASWCPPCQQFKADLAADEQFRCALSAAFEIQQHDFDAEPEQARRAGVARVPTFLWPGGRLTGYPGKEALLARLRLAPIVPKDGGASASTESGADNNAHPEVEKPLPKGARPPRRWSGAGQILRTAIPATFTVLQWAGVIGGTALTGGVGGIALAGIGLLIQRRRQQMQARSSSPSSETEGGAADVPAPFPRQLDEARQLLELRQSEGRVPLLDALRGLFLEDELDKLTDSGDPLAGEFAKKLRVAIDTRVDEVAPLTTKVQS